MSRGKAIEIVRPYLLAAALAGAYCWGWNPTHPVKEAFRDTLAIVSNCAVSGFGFLLAAASLLVAVKGSWYKQRAREAGVYFSLVKSLFIAMWWLLALGVASVVASLYDFRWWQLHRYVLSGWAFLAILALCSTIRALTLFSKLFLLIAEE